MNARDALVPNPKEHVTSKLIVESLRKLGFYAYRTDTPGRRGYAFHDRGLPDVFVALPGSPYWIALEIKRKRGGKILDAQRELADAGCSFIVRTVEEAVNLCMRLLRERFLEHRGDLRIAEVDHHVVGE